MPEGAELSKMLKVLSMHECSIHTVSRMVLRSPWKGREYLGISRLLHVTGSQLHSAGHLHPGFPQGG